MATFHPPRANRRAVAAPIPLDPPAIKTVGLFGIILSTLIPLSYQSLLSFYSIAGPVSSPYEV